MASMVNGLRHQTAEQISESLLERQRGTDSSAKSIRAQLQSSRVELEVKGALAGSGDTATISGEGREKAAQSVSGNAGGGKIGGSEKDQSGGSNELNEIRRQIEEVKAKLQEAQARLALVQGGSQREASSGTETNGEGEDPAAASARAAASLLGGNAEAEAIQAEIDMLNQQLMTLNQQLMKSGQGGGGGGGGGTRAGIGGESNGPSGQGQRISVTA